MLQALLSERITDCHVQTFCTGAGKDNTTDESDFSHINYCQAAAMVSETKKLLMAEMRDWCRRGHGDDAVEKGDAASSEQALKAKAKPLNDLLNEATLSLARVLTKQGIVSAKFGNHHEALVRCSNVC